MKPTQKQRIIKRLLEKGEISRNECLKVFISRLGAIICNLKNDGWDFETENRNGDYIYKITKKPFQEIVYKLPDGREIIRTELK